LGQRTRSASLLWSLPYFSRSTNYRSTLAPAMVSPPVS
jgi:hypothetical protein